MSHLTGSPETLAIGFDLVTCLLTGVGRKRSFSIALAICEGTVTQGFFNADIYFFLRLWLSSLYFPRNILFQALRKFWTHPILIALAGSSYHDYPANVFKLHFVSCQSSFTGIRLFHLVAFGDQSVLTDYRSGWLNDQWFCFAHPLMT